MIHRRCRCAGMFLALWLTVAAQPALAEGDPPFVSVGIGYYDINDNEDAAEFRVEYRSNKRLWVFNPFGGVMVSSDAAVYAYGGIMLDLFFGRRWVLTPNFAAGLYTDGSGKDLGHTIEFRSALNLAYRFDNRARLGLSFYHISNASLADNNPGTEVLTVLYSIPLNFDLGG